MKSKMRVILLIVALIILSCMWWASGRYSIRIIRGYGWGIRIAPIIYGDMNMSPELWWRTQRGLISLGGCKVMPSLHQLNLMLPAQRQKTVDLVQNLAIRQRVDALAAVDSVDESKTGYTGVKSENYKRY